VRAAVPLMLMVARNLTEAKADLPAPPGLYLRSVCALSGDSPTSNCPRIIFEYAIKGSTKINLCTLHKEINGKPIIAWPSTLQRWMSTRETTISPSKGVKIIRPVDGHTVILKKYQDTERIYLGAEGDATLYWYLDGAFIGACENGDGVFINVKRGSHTVSVLSGNMSDSVSFEVKTPEEINELQKTRIGDVIN
jgi:membrane carboxypeptidase/penicillin-binding protein PbpC